MPLRAYIDNEEIISIDQTEEQWNDLKQRLKTKKSLLTLPCCKQEGFLRTSSKGLKHFVHAKSDNTCDWKPESPEHLKAKIEIIEACLANGWKAIPEFSEASWRADVLAIQNEKKIAFEVQWSRQTYEETKFRQDRYKEANVRGCWFFRTAPKELTHYDESLLADKEIPAFKIFKDENSNIIAELNHTQLELKSLVDSLLKGRIKFCKHIRLKPKQNITIIFFEIVCWKCKKLQHCYTVEQNLKSVCCHEFYPMESFLDSDDIDKNPRVYEAVQMFLNSENGKKINVGQLKKRYSYTAQESYLSHGCYYCDAIFGDNFIITDKLECQYSPDCIKHITEIDLGSISEESPHWCFSENKQFCE